MRISDWSSDVCSSDLILACPGVDRGFSAHGTVHLCKQSGWNLYEMAPTLQYGRSKAHKITDDTAAQGCDVVVPLNAKFQQPIDQDLKHFPALGAFPHRQNDRLDPHAALSQGIRTRKSTRLNSSH